jgi:hypothetical protein
LWKARLGGLALSHGLFLRPHPTTLYLMGLDPTSYSLLHPYIHPSVWFHAKIYILITFKSSTIDTIPIFNFIQNFQPLSVISKTDLNQFSILLNIFSQKNILSTGISK